MSTTVVSYGAVAFVGWRSRKFSGTVQATRCFRSDAVGQGQAVGVWLAVRPGVVPCLRDPEYPLDEPGQVRLIAPRHAQPQVPRIRVHAR